MSTLLTRKIARCFRIVKSLARQRAHLIIATTILTAGCGPSLATMQPAHVAPQGHFQATAAVEIGIPTGAIVRTIEAGKALSNAAADQSLTADEERQVFEAGVNILGAPPSVGPHLALAYTVVDGLEMDVRYAGDSWRTGARYQILRHQEEPIDLTVGVGLSRSAYAIPMADFLPIAAVDDFTRWTVDVPMLVGTSRSWFRIWAGPKLLWSRFGTTLRLSIPGRTPERASFEGRLAYVGGQAGLAIGYRYLFLGIELTLAEALGSAAVTATSLPALRPIDFSGLVIYPSFGLMGEI